MASSRSLEEELRMFERENGLLKEKLHVHLDRWSFDRNVLQEATFEMARDHEVESAEQTYKLARLDLLHGMQIQRNLVLQIQIDAAQGEAEIMKPQVLGLKSALQLEKVNKKISQEKLKKLKSALQERFVQEAKKKWQQWQKLLESRQRRYTEASQKMKEKYRAHREQLNGRIQHLTSELAELNKEQEQWKLEKGELQNLAAEKKKLQTELEQVLTSLEERNRILANKEREMQELAHHRNQLMFEIERWESQKEEMQVLREDRDKLLAEKEREMQELALEGENLLLQRDEWLSQEKELQELRVERDQLKRRLHGKESEEFYSSLKERDKLAEKIEMVRSQREEEVKGLIRERDFVWNQMKKIEENYTEKLITVSRQLVQAKQEISKLRCDLQQAQTESTEKMVEMTVLKLEAKRAEDDVRELKETLATLKQVSSEGEATDLCTHSKSTEEEEEDGGSVKELSLQDLISQMEILQAKLRVYKARSQQDGGLDAPSKEGPEVLNSDDLFAWDQDTFVSQVEQGKRPDAEDGMKLSKDMEELRRENENLRVMYGQLEALYKEKQKPEKVSRNVTRKDPTSRNLKIELEAAATSSASEEGRVHENQVAERRKRGSGSKARVSKSKSAPKTTFTELSKKSGPGLTLTEQEKWENSINKASSSGTAKKSLTSSKPPIPSSSRRKRSSDQHADGYLKRVTRKSKVQDDSISIEDSKLEHNENEPVKGSTRKRKADSADRDETQKASLRPPPSNNSSTTGRKTKQHCSGKPETGSSDCKIRNSAKRSSSGLMSSLFSAAFSIPRLNMQSSSAIKS